VRDAVRRVFDHIASGFDLVFVVRSRDVTVVPFTRIQATVEQLLRRASLWRETPPQE
jgi:RNase P protein component